ncbi:hypothetical protein ASD24_29690 [Paenibacillus sp. Root52]|nr:hypothetical protein ASD24_29690 [Paenibacillus sp. Root52]
MPTDMERKRNVIRVSYALYPIALRFNFRMKNVVNKFRRGKRSKISLREPKQIRGVFRFDKTG